MTEGSNIYVLSPVRYKHWLLRTKAAAECWHLLTSHGQYNLGKSFAITISPLPSVAGLGSSVGCTVLLETRGSQVQPRQGRQHSFVEIDHEIFSKVIFSLPLIQEGQLSVSGERMCTILVNRSED